MAYLPHKESHPSDNSSLIPLNSKNNNESVKHGYYEQFYPEQLLSENIYFQIYSNEDYFIDFSSTFTDLHMILKNTTMKNQVQPKDYPVKFVLNTICLGK